MQVRDDFANDTQRVFVVVREMIRNAGYARVNVGAAELFGRHLLAGRGLHQRRAAQKNRAVAFDDYGFVGHCRDVCAARRARAHHRGNLRNLFARHARLIVEDAPEMLAIGKHFGLKRQKRAARIDQIDARERVLLGDFLRAQMLLDRHRIVGAAFDRCIVGDDDAMLPFHDAYTGDHTGRGCCAFVHPVRRERRKLEKAGARIDQSIDTLARRQFVAFTVFRDGLGAAACAHRREMFAKLRRQAGHAFEVLRIGIAAPVQARLQYAHQARVSSNAGLTPFAARSARLNAWLLRL